MPEIPSPDSIVGNQDVIDELLEMTVEGLDHMTRTSPNSVNVYALPNHSVRSVVEKLFEQWSIKHPQKPQSHGYVVGSE